MDEHDREPVLPQGDGPVNPRQIFRALAGRIFTVRYRSASTMIEILEDGLLRTTDLDGVAAGAAGTHAFDAYPMRLGTVALGWSENADRSVASLLDLDKRLMHTGVAEADGSVTVQTGTLETATAAPNAAQSSALPLAVGPAAEATDTSPNGHIPGPGCVGTDTPRQPLSAGSSYTFDLGERTINLELLPGDWASVTALASPDGRRLTRRIAMIEARPQLVVLSWSDEWGSATMHAADFASGTVVSTLTIAGPGRPRRSFLVGRIILGTPH
jgi:hypothetical protein